MLIAKEQNDEDCYNGCGANTAMQHDDLIWAQNVVERWAIIQAVPTPRLTMILTTVRD